MAEATEEVKPTPPPTGSKLVPLLLGVNCLGVLSVLGVMLLRPNHGSAGAPVDAKPAAEAAEAAGKPGPTLHLADFTTRLHTPDGDRYARLSIEIEVPTDKDKEDLGQHVPQMRDSFIGFLADSSLEDLSGSEGLAKTKEKLTQRLHDLLPTGHIRALYITDLVIQ